MSEIPLTLAECLSQPRGYEGRLFQPSKPERDISTYRILDRREREMDIQVYLRGGRAEVRNGVPLEPRLQDVAHNSKILFAHYVGIGKALRTSAGWSAVS